MRLEVYTSLNHMSKPKQHYAGYLSYIDGLHPMEQIREINRWLSEEVNEDFTLRIFTYSTYLIEYVSLLMDEKFGCEHEVSFYVDGEESNDFQSVYSSLNKVFEYLDELSVKTFAKEE